MNWRRTFVAIALGMMAWRASGQTPSHHPDQDSLFLPTSITNSVFELTPAAVTAVKVAPATPLNQVAYRSVEALDATPAESRLLALSALPGVNFQTAGGGTVRPILRGMSGLRVASYFYGARIESQAWGEQHGIYLPEEGIDRIEVVRGASTLVDAADALGGVLRFVPIGPEPELGRKTEFHLTGHSNTEGMQASIITRKRSQSAYHTFSGGVNRMGEATLPDGSRLANSDYRQFFAQGRFGYLKDWGTWDGAYTSAYNTAGLIGRSGWHQSGDHLITTSLHAQGKRGWFWHPTLSYQLNHRKEFKEADEVGMHAADALADFDLSLRTTRLDVRAEKQTARWEWVWGVQSASKSNENGPLPEGGATFVPDAHMLDGGGFVASTWMNGRFRLSSLGRLDAQQTRWEGAQGRRFLMGSAALGAEWTNERTGRFSVGFSRKNRAPGLAELAAHGVHGSALRLEWGNADLTAEIGYQAEVNWALPIKQGWRLEAALHHQHVQGFIHLEPLDTLVDGLPVYQTVQQNARISGAEFNTSFCPAAWIELKAAGSWIRARNASGDPLPLIPPANLRLEALPSFTDGAGRLWSFQGIARWSQEAALLDAGLTVEWNASLSTTLTATNVLNEAYTTILSQLNNLGIYEPGRNVRVRMAWTL